MYSIEQPKASIPDKKKRPTTTPITQKSKAPPPVVVIADSTSSRVASSQLHLSGRVAVKSSKCTLDVSAGSVVSTDPGGEDGDGDDDDDDVEEFRSQAALDATGGSQSSVPDDTEYDEVFEESTIKIEKWEDEEDDDDDDDRQEEDEEEEEDYSRENDDKWEDDEDDIADSVKSNMKQSEMVKSVTYEKPERPKFASFAGIALFSLLILS